MVDAANDGQGTQDSGDGIPVSPRKGIVSSHFQAGIMVHAVHIHGEEMQTGCGPLVMAELGLVESRFRWIWSTVCSPGAAAWMVEKMMARQNDV